MKITIDFENGMTLSVKPENLSIAELKDNNGQPQIAIAFKTDVTAVPFLFFSGPQFATKEEIAARDADKSTQPLAAAVQNKKISAKKNSNAVSDSDAGL